MGENVNVKRTIEELNEKQNEYIVLESELEKYQDILAEKTAQLQGNSQESRE